jgi:gamma-glutamyltranspeptidase/glutathione hydrolase
MNPAVAAGHPATTDAGIEILEAGGSAADAAVAASLASCVAETIMTGLLGGGHAITFDAASGETRNLDCFVAVPGLGAETRERELLELEVLFGTALVRYAVGAASCGVPGLPAGLHELWRAHGRLPWAELVEPALRLARSGVAMTPAHASVLTMVAPVMTMDEGARIYSPGGKLLSAGDVLDQPGLAAALELVRDEGAESFYRGSLAERLVGFVAERDGILTRRDLDAYEPEWSEPIRASHAGTTLLTRPDLADVAGTFTRLPPLRRLPEPERVHALLLALDGGGGPETHTTNITVVDGDGNACVLTTSLGLGSGDYVTGLDLHLNSMLGETDLVREPVVPGQRMGSMMAPTLAFDRDGLVLGGGAAGGTRLRTALVGAFAGVLDEGLEPQAAVDRPRFHPADGVVNAEPGVDEQALAELEARGRTVVRWPGRHHYFGGVSLIGRSGAAGDPRRGGSARAPGPVES